MSEEMQRIPVLQIITRLIVGGAQETVMYTAELLDRDRFMVDVLSGPQTGSEGSLIEEVQNRGISLTLLPDLVRQLHPYRDLKALVRITRILKEKKYSIVHTNSSKAGILGRFAAQRARIPIVIHTVHGWSFHDHMTSALRHFYITLERFVAPYTDAFVVVTDQDIEKGLRNKIGSPEKYHLIRSALPLDEFDPSRQESARVRESLGIPPDVPVLGNVGRFSPQKNPLDWVRVAARVAQKLPECWFLLVGDGPLRSEVENLLAAEGIADRTVLPGLRRDVSQMLSAIDVFLLSSLWEGLPRTIPQALAMQIPVIANRADGTVEAIQHGETGFLSDPGDLEEQAAYCLQLLEDEAKRRNFGIKGRQFVLEKFDIRKMIDQTTELYERLLHEKDKPPH